LNQSILLLLAAFFIAFMLDYLFVLRWKLYKDRVRQPAGTLIDKKLVFKQVFYDDIREYWRNSFQQNPSRYAKLSTLLQFLVLAIWAIYLGWAYTNMDPHIIPAGEEFGSSISSNHMWTQFQKCGWCATWNGFQRGGYPAFADIQGSMLHPVVIISTLLFGVVNGVKITLIISLWLAGLAQWWIARELELGWLPRMWSAGIAIAGGHLASRMEVGVPGLVVATATTSLVFAALIRLAKRKRRSDAILLGVCTASAIVSGQGYIQVGLLAILPLYALFFGSNENIKRTWGNYLIAALATFLLAAPFLVPFLHFSPNIVKDFDPEFKVAQPITYFILNLVIDDPGYYYSNVMMKYPYPHLYSLYIGWVPVLLFIYSLRGTLSHFTRILWFMVAAIILEFLVGSAILLKLLVPIWPTVAGVRHSPQITGLAIPFILGISAYGLDRLLKVQWTIPWLTHPTLSSNGSWLTRWLVILPLIYSLQSSADFASYWLGTTSLNGDTSTTLEHFKTNDLQWVNPPFGEHQYVEPAIERGMKLSPGILTWNWRNRIRPSAWMDADRSAKTSPPFSIIFKSHPENQYASIESSHEISTCQASGSGGYIEVHCDSSEPGLLTVQENMWTGWYAWMDGNKVDLAGDERLMVHAPAGKHTFIFRYLPWDVPVGFLMFFIGILYCARQWTFPERSE
jgi:hypothetical protein